ncbi:MAG: hypothetical protein HN458_04970 [Euryarchaeota archaeon]|jgi:hypothetical protein|nr:hypothetical protein [Euryarchaeota archaeon]
MGLKTLIGYVLSGLAVLLIAGGTVGYTVEGQIDDVPTPNIEGYVFFSDEALPGNPASLFITADTTVKWDRDDIFMVIADDKKKSQCDGIRANGGAFLQSTSDSQTCQYGDTGYEATATDGDDGLEWRVSGGEFYAGIGTKSGTLPAGTDLSIDYEVKLSAGAATYLFSFLTGIGGIGLSRMK